MVTSEDVRRALEVIGSWCIDHEEDDVAIKFNCIRNHKKDDTIRVMTYLDGDWNSVGKIMRMKNGTCKSKFNTEDGVSLWAVE